MQEPILEAGNPIERIQLLERFLLQQLLRRSPTFDRTYHAANLIVERKGVVNVSELMDDLYVCRRQFERQVADWHELIYQCGYYDQSHFIQEFTQFTGKRPSLYVKDNQELTQFLIA